MESVQSHNFAQVPARNVQRSSFDRGRKYSTTLNAGYLVPFYRTEVLPGDTFSTHANIFARMSSSLNVATMDNMYMDFFYFYVSNRLVWEHWKQFMGEKKNPGDTTTYIVPTITSPAGGFLVQSVSDYLGLPPGIAGIEVDSLYHRAYNLIWHEWFRDENLQDAPTLNYDDGPDVVADYPLLKRGKRHDYFTACLPWPQKGTAVPLPLGTSAPIIRPSGATQTWAAYNAGTNTAAATGNVIVGPGGAVGDSASGLGINFHPNGSLIADLTNATAATVNAIRTAFQGQMYLELDARGGTRYTELIRSHFGVISPDSRLQRPEFLGSGSFPININQVPNMTGTAGAPQGTIAAYALAGGSAGGFSHSFTEHGMIIGLASVRADITYQQGIHKDFLRSTKYDYYDPIFAHLGEQAVLNKEIFAQGTAADNAVFGYQERWAEYRYGKSEITGLLRSDVSGSLDVYHLAQDFAALPALNASFIEENPPIARITALTTAPQFIMDVQVIERAVRPMPVYSIPGMIDHL